MSRQNKKERQRLKRKRKQQELRKKRNRSVFQTLSRSEGEVECYINAGWLEAGEASIMVIRPVPGGSNISVAYLIDLWCSGLKDAFGRMNITRGEFEEHLLGAAQRDVEMIPLDLFTARRLVAGGMRLCVENGFRLPHKADRWASIIGVTGYADADLSDFEKPEGKYRYVGSMSDLRKRLVGPVDDFLDREDVEFVIGEGPFSQWEEEDEYETDDDYFDDESEEEGEEELDEGDESEGGYSEFLAQLMLVRERGAEVIEDWLLSQGRMPSPNLADALLFMLVNVMAETEMDSDAVKAKLTSALTKGHPDPEGLVEALEQILEFTKRSNANSRMLEIFDQCPDVPRPVEWSAVSEGE